MGRRWRGWGRVVENVAQFFFFFSTFSAPFMLCWCVLIFFPPHPCYFFALFFVIVFWSTSSSIGCRRVCGNVDDDTTQHVQEHTHGTADNTAMLLARSFPLGKKVRSVSDCTPTSRNRPCAAGGAKQKGINYFSNLLSNIMEKGKWGSREKKMERSRTWKRTH